MRKSSTSSMNSSKKQSTNLADSQKQQILSTFEQQKKDNIVQQQRNIIEALQNQLDQGTKTKEERFAYLQDILGETNLGVEFFQTNPQDQNKLQVEYDQINTAINTIKSAKKDTKRKETYKESPCASIGINEVKQRMNIINPDFPQEEIQFMFPPRKEVNSKELFELLRVNQIQKDPLTEALKLFLDQNGELNKGKLNIMMKYLGYGQIDTKEMNILKDILDIDQDGKITQEDLKEVFSGCNKIYKIQQQNKNEEQDQK
ncbi:hypothetical protein TTHERM_00525120 (macronuclear) [Tetrahymena thermophila SB210]|uniref:EF-hand domain-containing protein n=1 Tax=Tetrahymena thermophila (strain SB210) TaxID=312017 RepID=I7MN26_TETTS|nr:hypothetical protein TTHERM_00525120 [Tetrahymena thermophila SB210]EAS07780.1 hypothetical protein TTHERM_00525120 [Tetrahymena thermophila SB210]|eukprot:XP_001028022.1 hypothetical protein TTHERM_00525120 [Tetrahymena thermophila SB210]